MLLILTLASYSKAIKTLTKPEDLKTAWDDGLDFKIPRGPYCSIRDLDALTEAYEDDYGFSILLYGRNNSVQVQYQIKVK